MYQNRLRVDDFDNLFNEMGFSILSRECMTNPLSFKEFPLNKLCIHADYSSKPESSRPVFLLGLRSGIRYP